MRDSLATRRIFAKIDRSADLYEVADRLRQAINDIDHDMVRQEERINALEQERAKFVKETGVHRILSNEFTTREAKFGSRLFWMVLAGVGACVLALLSWFAGMAWKGMHAP